MKVVSAIVLAVALSTAVYGDSPPTERRDKALQRINACLRRNEVSSRQCRKLNHDVATLVDVYREGDKSVLPMLLKFTYLSDFYDEALLSDPEGFLKAVAQLPNQQQREVAAGVAGGIYGPLPSGNKFDALRKVLTTSIESSPESDLAHVLLKALETNNAVRLVNYFPPRTLTSRASDFQLYWYSRDMYSLGENPLWPPSSESQSVYRFTYLGSFTGPKVATLSVLPDGRGRLETSAFSKSRDGELIKDESLISEHGVTLFLSTLEEAHFWHMPTELPPNTGYIGLDGAEWLLEGVQNGSYHIVDRWCPGAYPSSVQDIAFANAARLLFSLAGHKHSGSC